MSDWRSEFTKTKDREEEKLREIINQQKNQISHMEGEIKGLKSARDELNRRLSGYEDRFSQDQSRSPSVLPVSRPAPPPRLPSPVLPDEHPMYSRIGEEHPMYSIKCKRCGNPAPKPEAKFCPKCGSAYN
jgi:hypothetical protein